jgi:hypothetical protein
LNSRNGAMKVYSVTGIETQFCCICVL